MSDFAWISTAPAHASNLRPLRNSFAKESTSLEAPLREISAKIKEGLPLQPNEIPAEIFGAPDAKEKDYKLPDLFSAYGFWAVSQRAAEVIRQFDLGSGGLYPVKVLKNDRQTPVEGEWFCINFGNCKDSFIPEDSLNVAARTAGQWITRAVFSDEDVALNSLSLLGPDVWIEPKMRSAIFFSANLGTALKKAKADKGFFLKKCRVV